MAPFARFRGLYNVETVARNYFAAEKRAQELLRSWLSLGQREQYDARGFFEVVGSDTSKRYRIYRGHVFNIQELDADGEEAFAWCLTLHEFATGDVNLAQKIALETFERKALAIANRSSKSTWRQAVRSQQSRFAVISGIHTLVPG